jgi:hypothetical protein
VLNGIIEFGAHSRHTNHEGRSQNGQIIGHLKDIPLVESILHAVGNAAGHHESFKNMGKWEIRVVNVCVKQFKAGIRSVHSLDVAHKVEMVQFRSFREACRT